MVIAAVLAAGCKVPVVKMDALHAIQIQTEDTKGGVFTIGAIVASAWLVWFTVSDYVNDYTTSIHFTAADSVGVAHNTLPFRVSFEAYDVTSDCNAQSFTLNMTALQCITPEIVTVTTLTTDNTDSGYKIGVCNVRPRDSCPIGVNSLHRCGVRSQMDRCPRLPSD